MKMTLMELKQNSTPQQFAQQLQQMGDLFWWEPGKFFVITSMDLAQQALLSKDFSCDRASFFISRMPEMDLSLIGDFFKVVSKMMVMSDDQAHTDRRRICYQGFGTQCIEQLKPLIQKTINDCLKDTTPGQPFDFVSKIAEVIPSVTLAELFAIPNNERANFYAWSNNMTQFFGGSTSYHNEDGIKVNHSAQQLYHYFAELIEERRAKPGRDFLSILLAHQSHFALSDDEIISQAIMMLVAGQVTTTDQLCNNLYSLLSIPGQWQRLGQHPEGIDQSLEECNRLDPAVTFIFRVSRKDSKLGGMDIPKGSVIFISSHAINRDPSYFSEADKISDTPRKHKHFSYGYGSHFCLGAKLARLEMRLLIEALLQRYPQLQLDVSKGSQRKHHSLSFSGFETLYAIAPVQPTAAR